MPRRRSQRYHQRQSSDDEFETPALQIAAQPAQQPALPVARPDSDDDLQSESGLGESPEEDLIEDQASDDNANADNDDDDVAVRGSLLHTANDDDDSDSAPEDVSFSKTREAETKRADMIKGALTQRKAEERERRRKRDELFKLQKKEKVAALKKRRLPEDVLEKLAQTADKKQKTDTKEDKDVPSTEEDREDEEEDFDSEEEDFIPLADASKEQGALVTLKRTKGQGRGTPFGQSVADFKRDMLYGARHKRVTSQEMRQQKAKSQARR